MAKVADKYYKVAPWKVIEEGFNPAYSCVSESIFSLGNEYMGVRGYFEEGYSGDTLLGSYFNGVYETKPADNPGYKGLIHEMDFMINSVDWLYTRVWAGKEKLDLAKYPVENFVRILDLKNGLLIREFTWTTPKGKLNFKFERLVSMKESEIGVQRISINSIDYDGALTLESGLSFDTVHDGNLRLWDCKKGENLEGLLSLEATTRTTKMTVKSHCLTSGSLGTASGSVSSISPFIDMSVDKKISAIYDMKLSPGETFTLEKSVANFTPLAKVETESLDHKQEKVKSMLESLSFDQILNENTACWQEIWDKSDIEIWGDEENQQGIRFCIFQMFQTYHGAKEGTNIGAKGLTGEAYNGNAFWDTETYCLPFFIFHDKKAAKNLLYFRYATLDEARKRARELDCKGAFYPIATISGKECCSLWQHASLQLQASTAVAYGIWCYEKITGDTSFTSQYGLEMLIEISRMLASRGDYNADHTRFGYYGVMGPDEFQMMVNHNCYTNYMGKFTLNYTLQVIERMIKSDPKTLKEVLERVDFDEREVRNFKEKAEAMYIPYDEERKLFEQHEGYFELPHIDVDSIPVEEFPLYSHWTYDRIYRNDMIKQPDVLMLMLLFNSSFTKEELKNNYEYYEPKCIHESSLSPSVHSILASQLDKPQEAFEFFKFATRMDLDNYNRNSHEGLHTTSIAAAWMNIVYGFGGLRSDGDILSLAPTIPENWEGYSFRIVCGNDVLNVNVTPEAVSLKSQGGQPIRLKIFEETVTITEERTFSLA